MNYNDLPVNVDWINKKDIEVAKKENVETYNRIKDLARLNFVSDGYCIAIYEIIENKHNLSMDHLALIADKGNLCFGYRGSGRTIIIHTD